MLWCHRSFQISGKPRVKQTIHLRVEESGWPGSTVAKFKRSPLAARASRVWIDHPHLRHWLEEDGTTKEIELGRERGENRVLNPKEDGNFEKKVMSQRPRRGHEDEDWDDYIGFAYRGAMVTFARRDSGEQRMGKWRGYGEEEVGACWRREEMVCAWVCV